MQKEGRFLFRTTKCPIAGPTCTAVHSTPKEVGHDFASTFGSSLSISSATTGSPAVPEEVARSELPDMPEGHGRGCSCARYEDISFVGRP